MITKIIDENSISVKPEDSDDLLNLRRIIKEDDKVIGDTTRVLKQDKDYSRPDKGERIKVRIALTVEKISLDDVLDRLRIGGTISESSNESVPHGSHHSFILKINDGITISKKKWLVIEKNLLVSSNNQVSFVLVAIDTPASVESFRRFIFSSTCKSYAPRSYLEDFEVFPERDDNLGSIYVEAVDKVTLKKIRDITFVNARDILGIIYNSKSGNTSLKWRQIRRNNGKVSGEASANSLTNLAESGVLTLDWVENYLKKKSEEAKTNEVTS